MMAGRFGWRGLALALAMAATSSACVRADPGWQGETQLVLAWEPRTIAFQDVCLGESETASVVLTNFAVDQHLAFQDAYLENLGDEFSVSFHAVALAPGGSVTAKVTYTPSDTPGGRIGTLVIPHDCEAQGFEARIPVAVVADAPLEAAPSPLAFDEVAYGQSKDVDVNVSNPGCAAVRLDAIAVDSSGSPGFTLASVSLPAGGSLPQALQPGGTVALVVRYTPSECSADYGTLELDWSRGDEDTGTWELEMTGTGVGCSAE